MLSIDQLPRGGLSWDELDARLASEELKRARENRIRAYMPYAKQREFHEAGRTHRERLLRAGNQLGKSFSGAAEAAYHLTGDYPQWWDGRRFEQATHGWLGGPSGELVRDGPQRVLLGPPGEWGTGMIPKRHLGPIKRASGTSDLADSVLVHHVKGGVSTVKLKTYEQGREKWQAATLDWLWFDEEPPPDIYTEGLSRTNATDGIVWLTFTPLLGMSDVVMRFITEVNRDRHQTVMTIDDAEHLTPEQRQTIIDSYPAHERDARTRGIPMFGSGRVFPVPREAIEIAPFEIPSHWARLGGLDFGWDHPFAAIELVHDRDTDALFVVKAYRKREATPLIHAAHLKPWDVPAWAWPHDGLQHDKGSGDQLAQLYRDQDLPLLHERAQFADGRGNGVEAGVIEMLDRMLAGRFKVFSHLEEWFEEASLYHRKDGVIVKVRDDLLDATRTAIMMLRHAEAGPRRRTDAWGDAWDTRPKPRRTGWNR